MSCHKDHIQVDSLKEHGGCVGVRVRIANLSKEATKLGGPRMQNLQLYVRQQVAWHKGRNRYSYGHLPAIMASPYICEMFQNDISNNAEPIYQNYYFVLMTPLLSSDCYRTTFLLRHTLRINPSPR
jgi:hypothetical protein